MTSSNRFGFTTRESYLQWRAQWKQEYRDLSQQIRDTKRALKKDQRENHGADQARYQHQRQSLRAQACSMIFERADAKLAAARLRTERLASQGEIA